MIDMKAVKHVRGVFIRSGRPNYGVWVRFVGKTDLTCSNELVHEIVHALENKVLAKQSDCFLSPEVCRQIISVNMFDERLLEGFWHHDAKFCRFTARW